MRTPIDSKGKGPTSPLGSEPYFTLTIVYDQGISKFCVELLMYFD